MAQADTYPLTPLQQGIVYHSRLAPDAGVYVQQLVVDLHEELEEPHLCEAWHRVVARHAVLQTRFLVEDPDALLQEVMPDAAPQWTGEDWSGLSKPDQAQRWRGFLEADRRRGFDFARAPLMRLALFRLGSGEYRLLWTFHHALLDGRSHLLVLMEVFDVYEALCAGKVPGSSAAPEYREFVRWLSERDLAPDRSFWEDALRGFDLPTRVVVDRVRSLPEGEADRGVQELLLGRDASLELQSFAASVGVTLGTLLQASWALLLGRYSGGEDVLFGATRACRHSSIDGVEAAVGLFINTVPLRVRITAAASVRAWLEALRSHWVAMRPHEQTPLVEIQRWSELRPGEALFETLLVFVNYSLAEELQAHRAGSAPCDVELLEKGSQPLVALAEGGSGLCLKLGYDCRRFDDETIARMLEHWQTLLFGLAEDPDRRVSEAPLLTAGERDLLLSKWNSTGREYPRHSCLHQLVEARAAQTPDAPAVLFEAERLSYEAINHRANRLAHWLQELGVGPEVRVVVCLERTPELIAAVLAVLKAGGAYVPVDPAYPRQQLASMIDDSGARLLLTQVGLRGCLPESDLRVVCLEADVEKIAAKSSENPRSGVTPGNLAYALYTSGSTGRPKLIGVEHRSAVNAIDHMTQVLLTPADLAFVPFCHSICFDPSVCWIFSALSSGGSLVVLDSLLSLARSRHAESVTIVGSAPSLLDALLSERTLPASVRTVFVGAEVATDELLDRLCDAPGLRRVFNFYGPTETTMYCSHAVLRERRQGRLLRAPDPRVIGRPISNAELYILDARRRPVPVGVAGELYVGGDCLARGYLNQPGLTAERFVRHPFSGEERARLYATGDLARYCPDGSIEFLGRIDSQIQLRGLRVEPEGIEVILNRHPALRESAVRVVRSPTGEQQLVAWIAPSFEPADSQARSRLVQEARHHLAKQLPRQMLPTAFVVLEGLPRTSRGKVDDRALPPPQSKRRASTGRTAPLSTDMEVELAQSWQAVLSIEGVGVWDDFFELGGDSLSAMRLVNRINRRFGTDLPITAVFDAPTVGDMALRVVLALAEEMPE